MVFLVKLPSFFLVKSLLEMVKIRFFLIISPFSPVASCSRAKSTFSLVKILILPGFWLFYSPKKRGSSSLALSMPGLPSNCQRGAWCKRRVKASGTPSAMMAWRGVFSIQIPWGFIWVYIIRFTNRGLNSVKLLNKKNEGLVRFQWDFEWDFNIL